MKDNCFVVLCWFLPNVNMNQPQVYLCPLLPEPPPHLPPHPTSLGGHRALGWAPCVTQQIPTGCLLHMLIYICSHATLSACSTLSIPLEKALAPHSSTLAWKIPWMEEPGRLQSMRSLRVGHDWSYLAAAACLSNNGSGRWFKDKVFLVQRICGIKIKATLKERTLFTKNSEVSMWFNKMPMVYQRVLVSG